MTVELTVEQRNILMSLVNAAQDECSRTITQANTSGVEYGVRLHTMKLLAVYAGIYDALRGDV